MKREIEVVKILFGGKDNDKPEILKQAKKDWFIYMRPLREIGLTESQKAILDENDAKFLADLDNEQ